MPPQQQTKSKGMSLKDFANLVREEADVPNVQSMSDTDIIRMMVDADPSVLELIRPEDRARTEPKPGFGEMMGSAAKEAYHHPGEFLGGMAAAPKEMLTAPFKKDTYKAMLQNWVLQHMAGGGSRGLFESDKSYEADKARREGVANRAKELLEQRGKEAGGSGALADVPAITKDLQEGKGAHALGRATTQGVLLGGGALRGLGMTGDAAKAGDLTKLTAPLSSAAEESLSAEYNAIKAGMANQYINAQRLSAGVAVAVKRIKALSKLPGAGSGGIQKARGIIMRLDDSIKANKNIMPWEEGHNLSRSIGEVLADKKNPLPADIRKQLMDAKEALDSEVKDAATHAGWGEHYQNVEDSWAELSDAKRRIHEALSPRGTQPQQATAKTAPGAKTIPFTRGRLQWGSPVNKIKAAQTKKIVDAAVKKFDDLQKASKARQPLRPGPPPTQPPPTPPTGGTPPMVPPGGGGGLPPVSGGSGGPMSGLKTLDKIKPMSNMQKAIQELINVGKGNVTDIESAIPPGSSKAAKPAGPAKVLPFKKPPEEF